MKKIKIFLLCGLLPVLANCAAVSVATPGSGASPPCVPAFFNLTGTRDNGNGNLPTSLSIHRSSVTIREGCTFEIRFPGGGNGVPAGSSVSVYSLIGWVQNSGSTTSPLVFTAPTGSDGTDIKFSISVSDIGILDPRVRVTN